MSDTKEVNGLSSALCDAMKMISQHNNTVGTLTIEARIVEVLDEGRGIYNIQYLQNIFKATALSPEITYNIDDLVYVLVPDGNFDKNKVILCAATRKGVVYADTQDDIMYIAIGSNLFPLAGAVSISSYRNTEPTLIPDFDTGALTKDLETALKDTNTFAFKCSIKTTIPTSQRKSGNYGLILTIPVLKGGIKTNYTVTLDKNNIEGDIYDFEVYAPQTIYFNLPKDMSPDTSKSATLKYFVSDFKEQVEEGEEAPIDIQIADIELIPCYNKALSNMKGYHVILTATDGPSFTGNVSNLDSQVKDIIPNVYYNGKVTDVKNFDCYWFRENAAVGLSSGKYNRLGGIGWEILNEKTATTTEAGGTESFRYVTNVYTYKVEGKSFLTDTNYKCVLVKDGTTIEDTITIRAVDQPVILEIFSDRKDNIYIENIGQATITMRYTERRRISDKYIVSYTWMRRDEGGNEIGNALTTAQIVGEDEEGNTIYEDSITFDVSTINNINSVYCSVSNIYKEGKNVKTQPVGTRSLVLTTVSSASFIISMSNGEKIYKYDADGDSPLVANYDGPLSSALKSITPISFTLSKLDGTPFSQEEYDVCTVQWLVPINSMIVIDKNLREDTISNPGYYTIKGDYETLGSLSYTIADTYNKNKTEDDVIVEVLFKRDTSRGVAHIKFLKDGEGGTNGSKYAAIITYNGVGYDDIDSTSGLKNKIQLFYIYDQDTWYMRNPAKESMIPLTPGSSNIFAQMGVNLYSDGERIGTPTITWSLFDDEYRYGSISSPIGISKSGGLYLRNNLVWVDPTYVYFAIVQALVACKKDNKDESITNSTEYIYAYYPIETIFVEKQKYLSSIMPSITGGFSHVLYASDGKNPQYDSSNKFRSENDLKDIDVNFLYDYEWNGSKNIRATADKDDSSYCQASPVTTFDNGVSKNYIRVGVIPKKEASSLYDSKIQNLTKDVRNIENELSYYSYLKENTEIFDKFNYNYYVKKINKLELFFNIKSNLVRTILNMLDQLRKIADTVNDNRVDDETLNNYRASIIACATNVNNLLTIVKDIGFEENEESMINLAINYSINFIILPLIANPTKSIHRSINEMVNEYNNIINTTYQFYIRQLDSDKERIKTQAEDFYENVFIKLSNYVNSDKWTALQNTYPLTN